MYGIVSNKSYIVWRCMYVCRTYWAVSRTRAIQSVILCILPRGGSHPGRWLQWQVGCPSLERQRSAGCLSRAVPCRQLYTTVDHVVSLTIDFTSTSAADALRRGSRPSRSSPTLCSAPSKRSSSTTLRPTSISSIVTRNCFGSCSATTVPGAYTYRSTSASRRSTKNWRSLGYRATQLATVVTKSFKTGSAQ